MSDGFKACPVQYGENNGVCVPEVAMLPGLGRPTERLLLSVTMGLTFSLLLLRGTTTRINEPVADL
jgi:hypothetical protein